MRNNFQILIDVFQAETQGLNLEFFINVSILIAILLFIPAFFINRRKKISTVKLLQFYLFLVYSWFVLNITILRRPIGSREGIVHLFINLGFGLRTGNPSFRVSAYSIYNIILFIPIGILAYLAFRNRMCFKSIAITTFIGLCYSLLIETTQLITGTGMFELTDILTNTTGSFIGAVLCALFIKLSGNKIDTEQK